jgi:NADPH:quinone reductase
MLLEEAWVLQPMCGGGSFTRRSAGRNRSLAFQTTPATNLHRLRHPSESLPARSESKSDMRAIQVKQTGGPEVLQLADLPVPQPKPNEAVVKIAASGLNFIDTYQREGRYKVPLPFVLGQEGAGVVTEVGADVQSVKPGDRVAWASILGSYAEYAAVPAERLVGVPQGVSDQQAAAAMLQGMTAHYLSHDTFPLKRGQTALVQAAAGGVGLLLVQMAHDIGARVIATVSTEEKAQLARQAGADEVILYTQTDFEAETKRVTGGKGVDVVYDGVGKTTFEKGLNVLRPRGMMVLFGGSSGAVPPFDLIQLSQKGSLFVTRPTLAHYTATTEELRARSSGVFNMIAEGRLKLRIEHTYSLADAQQAHRDLEGRKTTGKVLLIP